MTAREDGAKGPVALESYGFGRHLRRLREGRGMTVAQLGEAARLSVETIEQSEAGVSPSYSTLRGLAMGLDMSMSTLFESFERQDRAAIRELVALVRGQEPAVIALITRIVRAVIEGVQATNTDGDEGD